MKSIVRRLTLALLTLKAAWLLTRVAVSIRHRAVTSARRADGLTLGDDAVRSDPSEVDHLAETLEDPEARLSLDVAITRHGFHGVRA